MEQSELRAWEAKCIQEEPPFCQAACPLHVDVRAMMRHLAAGKPAEARKVLDRTMPLTEIFARICDHPCQPSCRRGDVDEAIRISAVERALVEHVPSGARAPLLPGKGRKVVLFGCGPSSLVAAHDLRRKGVEVLLRHGGQSLGGVLRTLPRTRLPDRALEAGLDQLRAMGVILESDPGMLPEDLDAVSDQADAVYIGLDDPWTAWASELASAADPISLATGKARIFASGPVASMTEFSPIFLALAGRKAVLSMERLFQGASLTAGREKEGPTATRLYTSIQGIAPGPVLPLSDADAPDLEQATQEAGRCLLCQCLECVKSCVFMEHYKSYPKKMAREIYNNLSVVQGMRQANRMILSCSNCGLCAAICPQDFDMGLFCMTARAEMIKARKMPGSAHDFALREQAAACSKQEAFFGHQPGTGRSTACFFPGCQLAGSSPHHVIRVLDHLRAHVSGGVGVLLTCCGAPSHWAARADLRDAAILGIRHAWEELGRPRMILGCTTCRQVLGRTAPDIPTRSLWEELAEIGPPEGQPCIPGPLALHDPCTARDQAEVRTAVRTLLKAIKQPVAEPKLSGPLTECCGFGGLMDAANPELADKVARTRAKRQPEHLLAYCAMCRDSLSRSGKPVHHVLDLLFPDEPDAAIARASTPLIRKGPGLPDRRQNRAWLRRVLSGPEAESATPAHQGITLRISPEVRADIDARRILDDDLQQVIHAAQERGRWFARPDSGLRLAALRMGYATFWAEYAPVSNAENTYQVHRAWAHRMIIKEQE